MKLNKSMRTFVAIRIPEHKSVEEPISLLRSDKKMKTYGPGGLHLTLCFIGNIEENEMSKIKNAIDEAVKDIVPFDISVKGMGTFPGRKGARILWIGADSNGILEKIAKNISENLSQMNFAHDLKKFVPHITIGRSKNVDGSELAEKIAKNNKDTEFFDFKCDKIVLYSSVLKPEGPVYEAVYEKYLN